MGKDQPVIWWVRRDFRLTDNEALRAAIQSGAPVLPVFIWDDQCQALGAAPRWRLGEAIRRFATTLKEAGSRLILRYGGAEGALAVLDALISQTGAKAVYWSRAYEPDAQARDTRVKSALKSAGVEARSFAGHLLFEPWTVQTKAGGCYRVFTPMWKALRQSDLPPALTAPAAIPAPTQWPQSDSLQSWNTGAAMMRGAKHVARHAQTGEAAALTRLKSFCENRLSAYPQNRDLPAEGGTSGLAEPLSLGEISPRHCWHQLQAAHMAGNPGAESFLRQLVWREFAYHLTHHSPHILTRNWREEWDSFDWIRDGDHPDVMAWKQGRTGMPFVDAAMREMYVTGRMHNRGRMIVASYLTKHLLCHWRTGQDWFAQCLTDWDPASNAMGWQWCAGSGPDAAPYFRIFNPETQAEKFDPEQRYRKRWLAHASAPPAPEALSYFDAIPPNWAMAADDPYPAPIVTAKEGRNRALAAYERWKSSF